MGDMLTHVACCRRASRTLRHIGALKNCSGCSNNAREISVEALEFS